MHNWVRFFQPLAGYSGLANPPNENILGYWCTGYSRRGDFDIAVICAVVKGDDPMGSILKDWPEAQDIEVDKMDKLVLTDRFVLNDWMKERGLSIQGCF